MANAKHNSYADGVNAGREQAGQHGFTGAPYREAVRTGWNGALDKLKARLVELGGPERSGWSVRLSAVIVEIEALRSAQHEQPPPTDPFVEWNNAGGHSASVREAFEAGRLADIKDRQRADVALATQAYVQEQVKKALDTAGAEMFSRYTDWGGRLEHLELLVKNSLDKRISAVGMHGGENRSRIERLEQRVGNLDDRVSVGLKTQDQRLTVLEDTKQSTRSAVQSYGQLQKVDAEQGQTLNELLRRLHALEQRTEGMDKHLVESVGTRLEELKERTERLQNTRTTGADLRNLDSAVEGKLREHRAMWHDLHEEDRAQKERIVALEQGHRGLMENLESVACELMQKLEARQRAQGTEDEAYQEWSAQPWSGDLEKLNEFFGNATGDCHRNASAAMEAGFRAGFRAARG